MILKVVHNQYNYVLILCANMCVYLSACVYVCAVCAEITQASSIGRYQPRTTSSIGDPVTCMKRWMSLSW